MTNCIICREPTDPRAKDLCYTCWCNIPSSVVNIARNLLKEWTPEPAKNPDFKLTKANWMFEKRVIYRFKQLNKPLQVLVYYPYCFPAEILFVLDSDLALGDLWVNKNLNKTARKREWRILPLDRLGLDYALNSFPPQKQNITDVITKNISQLEYNTICDICGAPAYQGLLKIECSNNCQQ